MRRRKDGAGQLLLPQQRRQLLPGGAACRSHGNAVLGKDPQSPCRIDALAAGVAPPGKNAVGAAGPQHFHLQRFIDSGIEGDGVNHKITSGGTIHPQYTASAAPLSTHRKTSPARGEGRAHIRRSAGLFWRSVIAFGRWA